MSVTAFDNNILEIPHNEDEDASVISLVRTAEASRLRRRGPFGLDHNGNRSEFQRAARAPLQPLILVPSRSIASESFELLPTTSPTPLPMTPPRQRQSFVSIEDLYKGEDDENDISTEHHIYCGVMEEVEEQDFKVSPLPFHSNNASAAHRRTKFTGCGTLIHASAVPKSKQGTWYAKGPATSVVVRLNAIYFDDGGGKSRHMHCGCRYYGVGCSVWYVVMSYSGSHMLTVSISISQR